MSVRANVIANFAGQAWRGAMQLAFLPVYLRYLGMEGMGLIGIFAILQAALALLDAGIRPTLAREMALLTAGASGLQRARDLLRTAEWLLAGMAATLMVVVWLASPWLAGHWINAVDMDQATIGAAITAMGAVVALRLVENAYTSSLAGLQLQVTENLLGAVLATVRALGAVAVLAWYAPTPDAFFAWQAIVSALSIALLAGVVWRRLPQTSRPAQFSLEAILGSWRFTAGMLAITGLALALTQVDKILLSRLLTLREFGYYALASTVAGVLYMLTGPVATAYYPRMTELVASGQSDRLRSTYHAGAQLVSLGAGTAAIIMLIFGERLLWAWTGDDSLASEVAPLLKVLAFGTLLNVLMWIPYQAQLAHGWTALTVGVNAASVLVLVPAILWAVPQFGAVGAAWVWVALNVCYVSVSIQLMHRRVLKAEKWSWYLRDLGLPLCCAGAVALAFAFWMPVGADRAWAALGLLVAGSCSCGAAWLALRSFGAGLKWA